jgi:short-subunit dehydrogenase
MTRLDSRVVWITGASSGIGEGLALQAASVNALGPDGRPFGRMDHDISRGLDPDDCADRIWRAVERDRLEVVIAGKERVAVWFKRFLPLSFYTAFARRLRVN